MNVGIANTLVPPFDLRIQNKNGKIIIPIIMVCSKQFLIKKSSVNALVT